MGFFMSASMLKMIFQLLFTYIFIKNSRRNGSVISEKESESILFTNVRNMLPNDSEMALLLSSVDQELEI